MSRGDVLESLKTTTSIQRRAEEMMLAAAIQAASLDALRSALDAAMSTTGLRLPTGLAVAHGQILAALWDLLAQGDGLSAGRVERRAVKLHGDEISPALLPQTKAIFGADPEPLTAREWGLRVAELDLKRYDLGQRVWTQALYRWFDWDDRLLYIGITGNLASRQESHSTRSTWSQFAARCTVERYPTREDVETMERHAIYEEKPLFNHVHNDTPEARERLVRYLIEHDRLDLLAPAVSRG